MAIKKHSFELTKDQSQALAAIWQWLKTPMVPSLSLGGFAGTGKTTLIGILSKLVHQRKLKKRIAFCAFTGKASQVLLKALTQQAALNPKDKVSTIHSLVYEAIVDKSGKIVSWRKKNNLKFDLIVVDEASMVTRSIWQDLLSFHIPILVIGDHGQLPPIADNFNLMQNPDLKLEQIHRQALNSPIIKVSRYARETGNIPIKKFDKNVIKFDLRDFESQEIWQDMLEHWHKDKLFLVSTNRMRQKLNLQIRSLYFTDEFLDPSVPQVGERVICLRNNWDKNIYNGMMGTIQLIKPKFDNHQKKHWYKAKITLDNQTTYSDLISAHQFGEKTTLSDVEGLHYTKIGDLFDYGYALTVHKSQGSQAKEVVVLEQRHAKMTQEDWQKWLYTAVTRAEEKLYIFGK